MWWCLLPDTLLVKPWASCSAEHANAIRDAEESFYLRLGYPTCLHQGDVHKLVLDAFKEPEVFYPFSLKPDNRRMAPAVMVGVIVLSLTLGESITEQWIML